MSWLEPLAGEPLFEDGARVRYTGNHTDTGTIIRDGVPPGFKWGIRWDAEPRHREWTWPDEPEHEHPGGAE